MLNPTSSCNIERLAMGRRDSLICSAFVSHLLAEVCDATALPTRLHEWRLLRCSGRNWTQFLYLIVRGLTNAFDTLITGTLLSCRCDTWKIICWFYRCCYHELIIRWSCWFSFREQKWEWTIWRRIFCKYLYLLLTQGCFLTHLLAKSSQILLCLTQSW